MTNKVNPIRRLRERLGWSMVRAAGQADMALNTWKRLENRPIEHASIATLRKAAQVLKVQLSVRFDEQELHTNE